MKVLIAIDSLKGSLSSLEAAHAIQEGIHNADPNTNVCIRPLADGGEGTARALTQGMHGHMETVTVTGPLGDPVKADYGIIGDTAVIEMAAVLVCCRHLALSFRIAMARLFLLVQTA